MNTGDKVILKCDDNMFDDASEAAAWAGLTGVVMDPNGFNTPGDARIQPDSDRPDGFGTEWFYWPNNLISKVE